MNRGKLWPDEVASVAKESAWVFPFLGMCSKLKESKLDHRHLALSRYSCILLSLNSNSPFTWPTINLESKNMFIAFPPSFWTMDIPSSRASYSTSLFVAEKSSLSDFLIVIFSGEIRTSPTPEPLWFAAPSTYTFQHVGSYREIAPTDFSPMPYAFASSSSEGSANSATKFARTCPLTEVRGMYLMSKAPRIVPHLAILLI